MTTQLACAENDLRHVNDHVGAYIIPAAGAPRATPRSSGGYEISPSRSHLGMVASHVKSSTSGGAMICDARLATSCLALIT